MTKQLLEQEGEVFLRLSAGMVSMGCGSWCLGPHHLRDGGSSIGLTRLGQVTGSSKLLRHVAQRTAATIKRVAVKLLRHGDHFGP